MLLEEFDPAREAILMPGMVFQPVPGMPRVAVSCFSQVTFRRLVEAVQGQPMLEMKSASQTFTVYRARWQGVDIALYLSAVGAPACVGSMEEIFAMGVETVVLFGTCGVLDRSIADCAIILPTHAMRDEGVSYHYAPASEEIEVNLHHRSVLTELLEELGVDYVSGKCWTTDAIYRETRAKAEQRRAQGCVCVDMECASCAAVAQFRSREVLQFFYAADNLDASRWDPRSLSNDDRVEEKDRIALIALEAAARIAKK